MNSPSADTMGKTSAIRVAIVGGGLAGLAAAVAASRHGLDVELFESHSRLGGRAGSFRDPASGHLVDHCRHVAMGCCTNLADFWQRTGIADCFRRDRRLWFIGPDGKARRFAASPLLPSPLHLAPGLMRLNYLSLRERFEISRTLVRLARARDDANSTIGSWLREQGQAQSVMHQFWSPILLSALSETLDRASLAAARKVFVDGFLASRRAYELEVPRVPLSEIYDRRLASWLAEHGVHLHLRTPVRKIEGSAARATGLVLPSGEVRSFDYVVVAVPWWRVTRLFPDTLRQALPTLAAVESIQAASITAVHLWFDRPVMPLPHAIFVGRLSQWVFNHSDWKSNPAAGESCRVGRAQRAPPGTNPGPVGEHYYQVVISASGNLKDRDRDQIASQVCQELSSVWPAMREAKLLRWRVVTNPRAVFSVRPELDRCRPPQQTDVPNLLVAGDWTATGWPATMEGAVRSGYLAVEAILRSLGDNRQVLVGDLPRSWLARWMLED
jgi:squalene-associated FAD-dependent desaturase